MKLFYLFVVFYFTTEKTAFSQSRDEKLDQKLTTIGQSINEKIKCCGSLKRKIIFTRGGEFILSYDERWNFFYLVPFTGKEEILKKFKKVIGYSGGIAVYETVTDEFEVTIQVAEDNYVVVSRFAKRDDALQVYKGMLRIKDLCIPPTEETGQ